MFIVNIIGRIIADELLLIFKAFPSLIVDHASDITEFTGSLRNMSDGKEHYFVHLVSTTLICKQFNCAFSCCFIDLDHW